LAVTAWNSGRFLAAARNLFTFWARNSTDFPLRSWSIMFAPPAVPIPGMAGGWKANARASGIWEKAMFSARTIPAADSFSVFRSAHSLKAMKIVPR